MRIPNTFRLRGKKWQVLTVPDLKDSDGTECHGLCVFTSRTIYLDEPLKGQKRREVFLHELFHAALYESTIEDKLTVKVEEQLCDLFARLVGRKFKLKWKLSK